MSAPRGLEWYVVWSQSQDMLEFDGRRGRASASSLTFLLLLTLLGSGQGPITDWTGLRSL